MRRPLGSIEEVKFTGSMATAPLAFLFFQTLYIHTAGAIEAPM